MNFVHNLFLCFEYNIRINFNDLPCSIICPEEEEESSGEVVTFLAIMSKVRLEACMWVRILHRQVVLIDLIHHHLVVFTRVQGRRWGSCLLTSWLEQVIEVSWTSGTCLVLHGV